MMVREDGSIWDYQDIALREFVERALGMYNLGRMQLGFNNTGEACDRRD